MPESRSDLLKISPELRSGRMWHDPQNCSFPELEESVSILSKVHPLQPEEKKVRQKTSTAAQMTVQQPENITCYPVASSKEVLRVATLNTPHISKAQNPAGASCRGFCPFPPRGTSSRTCHSTGLLCATPACYLAGYLWAVTRGLSFVRLSGLLPTARPEFVVKDNWNYKVPTLLSTSTLTTAGLEDLQIQKKLEHAAYPKTFAAMSATTCGSCEAQRC